MALSKCGAVLVVRSLEKPQEWFFLFRKKREALFLLFKLCLWTKKQRTPPSRTEEQQHSRTTEHQNSRTAEQQNSRTAEQQNSTSSVLFLSLLFLFCSLNSWNEKLVFVEQEEEAALSENSRTANNTWFSSVLWTAEQQNSTTAEQQNNRTAEQYLLFWCWTKLTTASLLSCFIVQKVKKKLTTNN